MRQLDDAPAVLIVDDDPANRLAFQVVLDPLSCPVVLAASGEEALRCLLRREFAVIVLDVQMPGMNGFEMAALLKEHPRLGHTPIIFVSARAHDEKHLVSAYDHGAVDYLMKPFEPTLLRAKVHVFIDLYEKQRKIRAQAKLLHEHELREMALKNERQLRGITESIPLPVWRVQTDGVVRACNRAWTDYSGLTAEETGVLLAAQVVRPEDLDEVRRRWSRGVAGGEPFELECALRSRSDAFRWHLLRAFPQRDDEGAAEAARSEPPSPSSSSSWLVVATDIDAQKSLDQERTRLLAVAEQARAEAEAANRMKDQFLATVSHELRTPLNAILGWTRMLRAGMLDGDRRREALERVERSAHMQARLVNDLLDVSRIVAGKLKLQVGPVDPVAVVKDALEILRPAAETKGIRLSCTVDVEGAALTGDAGRLQQVVWNLLANAVKFTPRGGSIDVRAEHESDWLKIVVRDDGAGIHPDFLPYIFDRFRQSGDGGGGAGTAEGLGLGLSIVKHVVELHGGSVTAASAGPGQGASFTVALPLAPAVDGATTQPSAPRTLAGGFRGDAAQGDGTLLAGATVLYVDDREDGRVLVEAILSSHGARVLTADSVAAAMRTIEATVPDVLISDIAMPVEDGYSLIRRVRALDAARGGNVAAIALTAYARPEDCGGGTHGFQLYLAKPVEPSELVGVVANLVPARAESAHAETNGTSLFG